MITANKLSRYADELYLLAVAVRSARHCHRVFMTGNISWNQKTNDREWYRDARNEHLARARRIYEQLARA